MKNKKQKVFEILNTQGYILDKQSAKIFGEAGLYKIYEYIRMWNRLNKDREYFKDKKIVEKKKSYRCHMVRIEGQEDNCFFKVGKDFFDEVIVPNQTH